MFDNSLELCYVCLPNSEQQFSIGEAFYIHVASPFKVGTVVKWNSPFYKSLYGVINHNLISREEDGALRYGDWSDVQESLDMYYPPEIISNIDPDNTICIPGFLGWEHIPYLQLETCTSGDVPEELKPLFSWKKREV